MGHTNLRPRVYLKIYRGALAMFRVLDLAFLDTDRPVAVLTWTKKGGVLVPGDYIDLDPAKLRESSPRGTWAYDEPVHDPRVPRPPGKS